MFYYNLHLHTFKKFFYLHKISAIIVIIITLVKLEGIIFTIGGNVYEQKENN